MGEFLNIEEREYHRDVGRFSGSFLDRLATDPLRAGDMIQGKQEPPPTDEMRLGKYCHALVLEGAESRNARFALPPNRHQAYRCLTEAEQKKYDAYEAMGPIARALVDEWRARAPELQIAKHQSEQLKRLGKLAGKKEIVKRLQDPSPAGEFRTMEKKGAENDRLWDDFVESAKGRTIIKHEQVPVATAMLRAIQQHPQASKLLTGGRPEVSMHWDCPHTGQPMKGRLDYLSADDEPVELKCTTFVSPENINRWLSSGWGRKGAIYLDAFKAVRHRPAKMWWIFVEMTEHDPKVHTCWIDEGHPFYLAGVNGLPGRYRGYVDLIRWGQVCQAQNHWRHPWQDMQTGSMIVPDWLTTVVENDEKQYSYTPPIIGGTPVEDYHG